MSDVSDATKDLEAPDTSEPREPLLPRLLARTLPKGKRLLVLLGLTGLAISQPLLTVLGQAPITFTFHGLNGFVLVWIAFAIAIVPPVSLFLVEAMVERISPTAASVMHHVAVWLLVAMTTIPAAKFQMGVTNKLLLVISAVAVATLVTVIYIRLNEAKQLFQLLSVLPLVALLMFTFVSQSSPLIGGPPSIEQVAVDAGDAAATPVVMLLLDELPTMSLLDADDNIDQTLFPNFARLADSATWYRRYTTTATLTERAVPGLMAGRDGDEAAPMWTEYRENLFTMLAPTHELAVFESATSLCGFDACTEGYGEGASASAGADLTSFWDVTGGVFRQRISLTDTGVYLGLFAEAFEATTFGAAAEDQGLLGGVPLPSRFADFVGSLEQGDRPGFQFLHLLLPHVPWRHFEDGELYFTDETSPDFPALARENEAGEWVAALTEQRHLWQTSYADALIGEFIAEIQRAGIYDDALVIVASDHGISFELDTPVRVVLEETIDSLAYAPLFIKYPGQQDGVIDDSNVMAHDVVPTIADVLGIDPPAAVTGQPIGSEAQLERGPEKYLLATETGFRAELRGILNFDDTEEFPSASDRWIQPDFGLTERADASLFVGEAIDSLGAIPAANLVEIDHLDRHERPGRVPHALVVGRTDAATDGLVLVAADGIVVAASPLYEFNDTPGSFAALLPQDLAGVPKSLSVVLVTNDGIERLTIDR